MLFSQYKFHPITSLFFFFFNDTATTEIYTLSLHDALPILPNPFSVEAGARLYRTGDLGRYRPDGAIEYLGRDRKSTRLNSSHGYISYAVFCLKKKKTQHSTDALLLSSQIDHTATATSPLLL